MESYAETQRTSGTKSSPSRHLSAPPAGHVLSAVHYCPFSCSFSPPSPAFALLLFPPPDIPILPSFYAALSLLLLFGFCPSQPPRPTDPLPPLPPLSAIFQPPTLPLLRVFHRHITCDRFAPLSLSILPLSQSGSLSSARCSRGS